MAEHRVGTRWRRILIDHGIGADVDHPVEAQRVRVALADARPGRQRRELPTELVIAATLDDLDVTARFARRHLRGAVKGEDRRSLQRTVEAIDRRIDRLLLHHAFRGDPRRSNYTKLPAYRAWRSKRRFLPVRRLCDGPEPTEGLLVPMQFTSPAHLNGWAYWDFIPSQQLEQRVPPLPASLLRPPASTARSAWSDLVE